MTKNPIKVSNKLKNTLLEIAKTIILKNKIEIQQNKKEIKKNLGI